MSEEDDDDNKNINIENLKKMPFLLKEGDFIGYLIKSNETDYLKDDFQTAED